MASRASISADNVTALIVTYGSRAHLTSAVIRRLSEIDVAQIVLIDNGSEQAARDTYQTLATELSQLKVLSLPENLGSAEGFSAGIKDFLANGKTAYLWVLDDDNSPSEDALRALSCVADELQRVEDCEDPVLHCSRADAREADAVALASGEPKTLSANHFMSFSVRGWFSAKLGRTQDQAIENPKDYVEIHRGSYGGLFASRSNIAAIGLPHAHFVLYADDIEYTYRFFKQGIRQFLIANAKVRDLEPTFTAGADYFDISMSDAKVYFSIRNHVSLSQELRQSKIKYELNKRWLLSLLTIRALRGFLTAPNFTVRRCSLMLHAIRHGESDNFNVASLTQFEDWNSGRGVQ